MHKIAIIGGGISGLSALHFILSRYKERAEPVVYEKEGRIGGTIGTDRIGGFTSDWGPNGFLDKVPLTLDMVSELGAGDLIERAQPKSAKRFIYVHERLHEVSPSPFKFLRSPLLSWKGRLRLAGEPFIKSRKDWSEDESIFEFASRRIGREAAETLIDPMTSGIFGGDPRQLSLKACFPMMVEMEQKYGSLVKALMARRKDRKNSQHKSAGPAGPGGILTSFQGGLNTLMEIFESRYTDYIHKNHEVSFVTHAGNDYIVSFVDGSDEKYSAVICAAPAFAAANLLKGFGPELSGLLAEIPYAAIAVVCLGYRQQDIGRDLDGFGFVVPRFEGKKILGTIWTSSIFSDRSPQGMIQLRTMIGGATDPDAVSLTDGQLIDIVTSELGSILKIKGKPAYVRIFRYQRGIPQFIKGHPQRMERIMELLTRSPGLFLTGNAYEGVGLNDCVLRSGKMVSDMAEYLSL